MQMANHIFLQNSCVRITESSKTQEHLSSPGVISGQFFFLCQHKFGFEVFRSHTKYPLKFKGHCGYLPKTLPRLSYPKILTKKVQIAPRPHTLYGNQGQWLLAGEGELTLNGGSGYLVGLPCSSVTTGCTTPVCVWQHQPDLVTYFISFYF